MTISIANTWGIVDRNIKIVLDPKRRRTNVVNYNVTDIMQTDRLRGNINIIQENIQEIYDLKSLKMTNFEH